jgi:hypothetical protein
MKLWIKSSIVAVVALVGALVITDSLLERGARRAATFNGTFRDFHDVAASDLEQQVRTSLPIGSSRATVQNYLANRGMRFRSSDTEIDAAAPYLKGSNFVVRSEMSIGFHFDNAETLQSIHTSVTLTGP